MPDFLIVRSANQNQIPMENPILAKERREWNRIAVQRVVPAQPEAIIHEINLTWVNGLVSVSERPANLLRSGQPSVTFPCIVKGNIMFPRTIWITAALSFGLALPAFAQTAAPTIPAPIPVPSLVAPLATGEMFYNGNWSPTHWRASETMGQTVYNRTNDKLGEIQELLIEGNGQVVAAVIGMGGFLGMGERDVAINYRALQITRDPDGKSRLVVDADKATLLNAPAYKTTLTAKQN